MDVLEAIKGRRAVRRFKNTPIARSDMRKIVEAGIWAPSGSNIQPWEFIVIMEESNIAKIKLLSPGLFGNPKAVVVVCINTKLAEKGGKMGKEYAKMDIAMASQNMMLTAYSLGIGSCPVVSFDKVALKELLKIPDHIDPVLLLIFGYPTKWPRAPRRRPLNEVMHNERYGEPFE